MNNEEQKPKTEIVDFNDIAGFPLEEGLYVSAAFYVGAPELGISFELIVFKPNVDAAFRMSVHQIGSHPDIPILFPEDPNHEGLIMEEDGSPSSELTLFMRASFLETVLSKAVAPLAVKFVPILIHSGDLGVIKEGLALLPLAEFLEGGGSALRN